MPFDFKKYPKKVNLGCGFDKLDGFLNIDKNSFHHPDLLCDVTDLQQLPSSYYDYAIAKDVLEHIPRLKIKSTLKEWNRILNTGAILELQVPNVIGLLGLLEKKEYSSVIKQEQLMQCLFGTQAYDGDFHYFGFTKVLIKSFLEESGFFIEKITIKDEWLFVVVAKKLRHCDSEEILKLPEEHFILEVYKKLLGREPDEDGYQFYLNMLKEGCLKEAVMESLKQSEEYKAKHS